MEFDLTTFAGVSVVATFVVEIAKKFLGDKLKGREALVALVLGVALAVASKFAGIGFVDTGWLMLVMTGLGAGVASQVVHDKVVNPVSRKAAKK